MNKILALLILTYTLHNAGINCLGQSVIPHPVPEEFLSNIYTVEVNDIPVDVFHAGLNVHFVSFDFAGEVKVKVTGKIVKQSTIQPLEDDQQPSGKTGFWDGDAFVKPISSNILVKTLNSEATFTLTEPGQYTIESSETTNYDDVVLFILANRPETERPNENARKTIYLKPGIHCGNIDLKSGQTLYLEAGAVLFGGINIWNAKDVKILGRGTVLFYGPQSETHDDGYKHLKNWHPLTTSNSERISVSGVSFIGRSRTWVIQMYSSFDVEFDNVKIFGVNPQNVNGDGFDWFGGGNARITNSLVRSADDCFAFFTPGASKDMWSLSGTTEGEVRNILIDNCVLWPTRANVYRVGFNGQNLKTDNIVMTNTDIIHVPKGEWHAPRSAICAVSPNNTGRAVHSNYRFENIRFEEPAALLGLQNAEASFHNIVFKNISMKGEPIPSLVKSSVDGLSFDNVILNGKMVMDKNGVPFKIPTTEIINLKFLKSE